ncbi:MAG: hemerythrin domain-containing protein [Gallionella sp.]|nr:hemerythrin domain-containing protein [Gallionella sp.]MDP1592625.1 hemerythrin domain-containing protein [Gallionella sp.]
MNTIAEFMSTDHRACDLTFATAEQAALTNSLSKAETAFETFRQNMQRHFRMEEEVLFPALLDAGGPGGPVQVMRMEHAQMNELIELMAAAVANKNTQEYSGLSETLLIVMQQHNLKEEQILYPIADRILAAELESLFSRMQAIQ